MDTGQTDGTGHTGLHGVHHSMHSVDATSLHGSFCFAHYSTE